METITIAGVLIGSVLGLVIGLVINKITQKNKSSNIIKNAKKTASQRIKGAHKEAESIKKDKILQAKERFIELKAEHEKVILSREKKIGDVEKRIRDKESQLGAELDKNKRLKKEILNKEKDYNYKLDVLEKKEIEVEKVHKRQVEQLEVISGISAEEAKSDLITSLKDEAKTDAMSYVQEILEEAKLTAEQEARKIILNTIQRVGVEQSIENCVSVFNLESDDSKSWSIIHNNLYTSSSFYGTNISTFSSNNTSFNVVTLNVKYRNTIIYCFFCTYSLYGINYYFLSILLCSKLSFFHFILNVSISFSFGFTFKRFY